MIDIIVMDLGATKCALALLQYNPKNEHITLIRSTRKRLREVDSYRALVAFLHTKLDYTIANADAICLAGAGRYHDEHLHLEHGYPYPMPIGVVARELGWSNLEVVHDYTPIACATFTPFTQDVRHNLVINAGAANAHGRRIVLGVGTGLGVKDCVLLQNNDLWFGANEAGHIGVPTPPLSAAKYYRRHEKIIAYLRQPGVLANGEGITFESLVSGKGLVRFYHALNEQGSPAMSARDIAEQASQADCQRAWESFYYYLGLFVGMLQLTMMPSGGIWMAGGVIQKNHALFDQEAFMAGLHALPAYNQERMAQPISLMLGKQHVFYGGAFYAVKHMLHRSPMSADS